MNEITFSPRKSSPKEEDPISRWLLYASRYLLIIPIVLVPIFFIPDQAAPLGYTKTILVLSGLLLAVILYAFATLRSGIFRARIATPTLFMWLVIVGMSISALFSIHIPDSLFGVQMSPQTVLFVGIFGLIVTVAQLIWTEKRHVMSIYLALFGVSVLLGLFHLIRLLFGPEVLSFGLFTSEVFTPIGNWNELAIFFGLILILNLLVLEQLPLPKLARVIFTSTALLSLVILTVVQFTAVWVLVGFISLVVLMYGLVRHRFDSDFREASPASLAIAGLTVLCSLIFLVGGSTVGSKISEFTNINYLEVRPSVSATVDLAQQVYARNAITGVGSGQFVHVWREYKDPSINSTIFWSTDFFAGSGYLPTIFATSGLLVTILWLLFFGSMIYSAYTIFIRRVTADSFWYFIASSSYISAFFLWSLSFIYVPGPSILILTALCTGIALISYSNITSSREIVFNSIINRQATVLMVAGVLVTVLGSSTILYHSYTHYAAAFTFNQANMAFAAGDLELSNQKLQDAYSLHQHHSFARQRAFNGQILLNQLIQLEEPTEEQVQRFQLTFQESIAFSQIAIQKNPNDARNWAGFAAVLSTAVSPEIVTATEQAYEAIARAQALDSTNPELYALEAQIAIRSGDSERAREALTKSLNRKRDYIPALGILAELDIIEGNIANARNAVVAILQIEPNNPGRYYQLAVLLLAEDNIPEATAALEQAVSLDGNFANARYLLALQYAESGQQTAAIEQLEVVQSLNPDNQDVATLINQIRSGEDIAFPTSVPTDLATDEIEQQASESGILTDQVPDTNLLTPVNTPGSGTQPPNTDTEPSITAPTDSSEEEN